MRADAVIFTSPNVAEFGTVQCPDPGPRDAVIRLTHSWISNGTEGSYLRGERINGDTPYRPGGPYPFPIVAGYQRVGIVEQIGEEISDLEVGETVFSIVGKVEGMFQKAGGQVSPSVSERSWIWKLPKSDDPVAYSGLVLTQVGYNCGSRAPIQQGEWALVIGDGLVGQWCAQTLTWRGAKVVMLGRRDRRLAIARELCDCDVVDERMGASLERVSKLANGEFAVVVDTVGSPTLTEDSIRLLKRSGHIVSAGFIFGEDRISLQSLRDKEISLDSVAGTTHERMDRTLDLIHQGVLKTLPLITHHFPARDAAKAWAKIQSKNASVLGVVLDW